MKKMTVLDLCLCAMMAAMHIVLELFCTVRIGETLKITISSLPFVICGMLCGPVEGLVTGLVGSFLSQMLGPYGLMITTPIWIIPGAMEGLSAGLIYKAFRRRNKVLFIALTVFISGFVLLTFNWFGSYLGSIVILRQITIEGLWAATPVRILKWVINGVVYTIILIPLCKTLQKKCPADLRAVFARKKSSV